MNLDPLVIAGILVAAIIFISILVTSFLRTVGAGTIRIVSWFSGKTNVYRGPGKSLEIPLFTTGTTIPSKAINIDLDISDQTADVDRNGQPRPIKVRVLASAIVSVGDTNEMIRTAANRFFAKPPDEQISTLTDLLTSTGRRAINLLHHDELFNAKATFPITDAVNDTDIVKPISTALINVDDDDRLAIIIKSACSRELQDLGLSFNSLNIKSVQSDVADARRRESAVEAKANADIVQADQERRAKEAQLAAETAISDKQRELDERRAQNAAKIADAEANKQLALQSLREAELKATQIAQADADAQRVRIQAEASADAEAVKLRKIASAQSDAIRLVTEAMEDGGHNYLALKQLELLPAIAPSIAAALAEAKLINISSDPNQSAATGAADQISQVIQTVIAAQLVNTSLNISPTGSHSGPKTPQPIPAQADNRPDSNPLPSHRPAPVSRPSSVPPMVIDPSQTSVPPKSDL